MTPGEIHCCIHSVLTPFPDYGHDDDNRDQNDVCPEKSIILLLYLYVAGFISDSHTTQP